MELPRRSSDDALLPDGSWREAMTSLRQFRDAHELRIGIVYAFDVRTCMLPYWYADKRMVPCSVRTLGDVLDAAGFRHLRIVLQQWTPRFRPSLARLDGKPLDLLLISSMQVHAEKAYDLIRDAHLLLNRRPLILAGGPKATYEPTDFLEIGPHPGIGADCVVTGEVFILLDFLRTILPYYRPGESLREAFQSARESNALAEVPGLAYLYPAGSGRPVAIHTGVQRLLRDLDELPMPDAGYRMLEPPHRGQRLRAAPLPAAKVRHKSPIASVIATHGCKFTCPYCPIPAANQRTWRHKSPQRMAAELKHIHEQFGIRIFFGTDDNFFNNRETVINLMTALRQTKTRGVPLGKVIRFYTEATQFDVFRNRDLLGLCRKSGLRGIWFGIEDITAELVNKGQQAGKMADLFAEMNALGIVPMAMLIHSDTQPLRSQRGNLAGLLNQARYLFRAGAISYQCTYLMPMVGTRGYESALVSGTVYQSVGHRPVPEHRMDGNHIVASRHARPWRQQLHLLLAYATFYNPANMLRGLLGSHRDAVSPKRLAYQLIGQVGLLHTIPKMLRWAWRLRRGPIERHDGLSPARIPLLDVRTGQPIQWAVEHLQDPPEVPLSPIDRLQAIIERDFSLLNAAPSI